MNLMWLIKSSEKMLWPALLDIFDVITTLNFFKYNFVVMESV